MLYPPMMYSPYMFSNPYAMANPYLSQMSNPFLFGPFNPYMMGTVPFGGFGATGSINKRKLKENKRLYDDDILVLREKGDLPDDLQYQINKSEGINQNEINKQFGELLGVKENVIDEMSNFIANTKLNSD